MDTICNIFDHIVKQIFAFFRAIKEKSQHMLLWWIGKRVSVIWSWILMKICFYILHLLSIELIAITCYQIHPTKAKKIVFYGTWNIKDGLSISSEDKWVRRKDLEVCSI